MIVAVPWSVVSTPATVIVTFLTMFLAVSGLKPGSYYRGKLTRRGWTSVLAVVVLGLTSLISSLATDQIAAGKEKASARQREQEFAEQMASLKNVTRDLGTLRTSLQRSLQREEQLYDVANSTLRMSGVLQQQAEANTHDVLRRVFAESNRIAAERIAIAVSADCPPQHDEWHYNPTISRATIIVDGSSQKALRLVTDQALTVAGGGRVFYGFMGDLGRFETFAAWRDAHVTIELYAPDPDSRPRDLGDFLGMTDDEFRKATGPGPPVTCQTSARLLLNGRQVLTSKGALQRSANGDYRALFQGLRLEPERLPHFAD